MTELIVLGTIPGTNIHIDFNFWMMLFGFYINLVILSHAYRHRTQLNRWLAGYILAAAMRKQTKLPRLTA